MCTFLHFALAQSSLIPTWTLRFQRRTLWEQVSFCPELWLQRALRGALGHCSRLHSLRWRSYGCWVVCWFLPGASSPWRLFLVQASRSGHNPDHQQQPQWSVPGPAALIHCSLLWDRWSSPILSLLLPSLGWPVGQSFRPQLGSHSLQHCFRSRIL